MGRFNSTDKPIAQKLFDQMVTKVIAQGRPSMIGSALSTQRCALRGNDGLCCAVGALIKDELFNPAYNCLSPVSKQVLGMIEASQDLSRDTLDSGWFPSFIKDCQNAHDEAFCEDTEFVARVTASFCDIALAYDLQMPVLA